VIVWKPPQNMRLPSNGIFEGSHRLLELRVFHDRLADAVAVLLVPIHDPCQRRPVVWARMTALERKLDRRLLAEPGPSLRWFASTLIASNCSLDH
jgi:hypothetical protein